MEPPPRIGVPSRLAGARSPVTRSVLAFWRVSGGTGGGSNPRVQETHKTAQSCLTLIEITYIVVDRFTPQKRAELSNTIGNRRPLVRI
eukprot:11968795-Alexandrium_andersonii.AAC.1